MTTFTLVAETVSPSLLQDVVSGAMSTMVVHVTMQEPVCMELHINGHVKPAGWDKSQGTARVSVSLILEHDLFPEHSLNNKPSPRGTNMVKWCIDPLRQWNKVMTRLSSYIFVWDECLALVHFLLFSSKLYNSGINQCRSILGSNARDLGLFLKISILVLSVLAVLSDQIISLGQYLESKLFPGEVFK